MWFVILYNFLIYFCGYALIATMGGIKNNLIYTFYLSLCNIYCFITPLYFYFNERRTIWGSEGVYKGVGVNILDYYEKGLMLYATATLLFIIGYNIFRIKIGKIHLSNKLYSPKSKAIFVWWLAFMLVLINLLISGVNPINVIFGSDTAHNLFNTKSASNYLRNFSDTIITAIIISYLVGVNRFVLFFITIISFILFILMGFRYRIILTILGFIIVYFYKSSFTIKKVLFTSITILIASYLLLFVTYNRFELTRGDFSHIIYNPTDYDVNILFEQTRGALADYTIIKYYDSNLQAKHDYGITSLYFIVRALPRSMFGNFKDNLYPPPAFKVMEQAYGIPKQWGTVGEAILHYGYMYIAGGKLFLFISSFLLGFIIKILKKLFSSSDFWHLSITIILCQCLFQWITRGYFPQTVDHFTYLVIGVIMFRFITLWKFKLY